MFGSRFNGRLLAIFSFLLQLLEIYLRFYLQHLNVYQFCKMSVIYCLFVCLSVTLPMVFDILAFFISSSSSSLLLKNSFDFYLISSAFLTFKYWWKHCVTSWSLSYPGNLTKIVNQPYTQYTIRQLNSKIMLTHKPLKRWDTKQ